MWISTEESLPPENMVVETKIDDADGCRNIQPLYRKGNLYFIPEKEMYVYYVPTHWRYF